MTLAISCAFAPCADTPEHVRAAEHLGYERAWVYDSPSLDHDASVFASILRTLEAK